MKQKGHDKSDDPRLLTPEEAESLLKEAKESSAWMRAEIKRRNAEESTNHMEDNCSSG